MTLCHGCKAKVMTLCHGSAHEEDDTVPTVYSSQTNIAFTVGNDTQLRYFCLMECHDEKWLINALPNGGGVYGVVITESYKSLCSS
jgi:hypothetical protein